MKASPRLSVAWSLILPLGFALLVGTRAPIAPPAAISTTTTSTPKPEPPPATATTPTAPSHRDLAPILGVGVTVSAPAVAEPPDVAALLGSSSPASSTNASAVATPSQTAAPSDSRIAAVEQRIQNGDFDQAKADLVTLSQDQNRPVAAAAQFLLAQTQLASGNADGAEDAFQRYVTKFSDQAEASDAAFALGQIAFTRGQRDQASGYLQQYLKTTSDHALDSYALADLAQIALDNGDATSSLNLLRRAVEAGLPLSREAKAATTVAAAMEQSRRFGDAADWYAALAARPSNDPATRAHYQILQATELQRAGRSNDAITVYRKLIDVGAGGADTAAAITALQNLGVQFSSFTAGEAYLRARQYDQATRSLGDYLDQNPDGPDAATARLDRGRALMGQNSFAAAAEQLDRFVSMYPNDPRVGTAALLEGQSLEMAGDTSAAVAFLQKFGQQHASDPSAPQALANAIDYLQNDSNTAAATQLERKLIASFPNSPAAALAAFDLGWNSYEDLDFAAAKSTWQMVLDRWPNSTGSAPALLWLGKMEQRAGNVAAAQRAYDLAWKANPGDYYAFRARELGNALAGKKTSQSLALPSPEQLAKERSRMEDWLATWTNPPPADRSLPYLGAPISRGSTLKRIEALDRIGFQDDAFNEIKEASNQFWEDGRSLYALADVLSNSDLTRQSLKVAYHLLMISPAPNAYQAPVYLQRLVYPMPYRDLIEKASKQFGVDPLLLVSLIRQESAFDTMAHSPAGAIGLTQFMPGTAQGVAARIGLSDFTVDDLYQPSVAIQMSAAYLSSQVKAFGGNPYFALAAYNAGGGNVLNWLSDNPRRDIDLLVEEIPFKETTNYVRNIYRFYQEYQFLYRANGTQ